MPFFASEKYEDEKFESASSKSSSSSSSSESDAEEVDRNSVSHFVYDEKKKKDDRKIVGLREDEDVDGRKKEDTKVVMKDNDSASEVSRKVCITGSSLFSNYL